MEKQKIRRCGLCARLGDEVHEDWMSHDEHYHECPYAAAFKGYAEEEDLACIWFKKKE